MSGSDLAPIPPRCSVDPGSLVMNFTLTGARERTRLGGWSPRPRCLSAVWLMSCHPGHRHNYPAQAARRGGQGNDKLQAYPGPKSWELITGPLQVPGPVPVM